jgi:DNA mismatch endonuclease (patch repair protein)
MQQQRTRDTTPEMALRSLLHRRGHRYRVDVRPVPSIRRRADLVFSRVRVAVFVDGCFWHSCPEHGRRPKSNAAWWCAKLRETAERDADTTRRLREAGWLVVRIWEHDDPAAAAALIESVVASRHVRRLGSPRSVPRIGDASAKSVSQLGLVAD